MKLTVSGSKNTLRQALRVILAFTRHSRVRLLPEESTWFIIYDLALGRHYVTCATHLLCGTSIYADELGAMIYRTPVRNMSALHPIRYCFIAHVVLPQPFLVLNAFLYNG